MAERGGKRRPVIQLGAPSKSYNYGYKKELQETNETRKVATLVGDYSDSDSGSDSSTEDKDEKIIAEDPKPAAEVKPAAEIKLAEVVKPAAEIKLAAEVKPAAEIKLAAEVKPAAEIKLAAEVKPAAQLKTVAELKPAAEATESIKTETTPPGGEKTDVLDDELKHFFSEIEAIPGPLPAAPEEDQAASTEADDDQISEDPKAELAEDIKTLDAAQPAPKKFQYPMFVKGESEFVHSPQRAEGEAGSLHKEPEDVDIPEEPTTAWQMVQDEHTSYYYYWNVDTNEVTWDIPTEYTQYLLLHREYEEKMARYSPEELLKFKKIQLMKKVDSSRGNCSEPEKTTVSNLSTTRTTHPQEEVHFVASAGMDSVSHNLSDVPSSTNVLAAPEEDLSSLSPRCKKEKRRHHKKKHKQKDETSPPNQRKHLPKREKMSAPESSVVMVKPMAKVESKLLSIVPYLSDDDDEENSDTYLETQVSSATDILDSLAEVFDSKPLSSDVVISKPLVSETVQNADVLATAAFIFEPPPPPPPPLDEEAESIKDTEKETEAVHKNIKVETLPGDDENITDSSPLHVLHTNAETKIDMFEDDLSKVAVCVEESSKIDMFEDESPKLGMFKGKSSKIDMFTDKSSKIDIFKDEPTKTDMFKDEPTKTDMFKGVSTKIDMFEDKSSLDDKTELVCDDEVKKEVMSVNAILPQIGSLERSETIGNSHVKVLDESDVAGNDVFQVSERRDHTEDVGNGLNIGNSNEKQLETLESVGAFDVREEVVVLSKHSEGLKASRENNSFKKEVELDPKLLSKNVNIVEYGDSTLEEDLESSGSASRNRETSKKKNKESRRQRDLDENTDKSTAVNKNEKKDSLKPYRSDKNTDLIVSRKVEKKEDTLKRHVKDSNRDLDRYGNTDKKDDSLKSNRNGRSTDLRESSKADRKDDSLRLSRVDRNSDLSSSGKLRGNKDSSKMQRVDNIPIASGKTEKRYDSSKPHRTDENTDLNKSSNADKKDKSSKSHRGDKNKESSTSGKVEKKDDSLKPLRKDRNADINKSSKVEKTNESSKSHQVDKNKDLRTSGKAEKKDESLKADRVDRNIGLDTLCTKSEDKESLTPAPGHRKRSHQEVEDDDADLDFNIDEIDLALEAALEKKKAEQLALKTETKPETVAQVIVDADQSVTQPQKKDEESGAAVKKESSTTKSEDNEEDKMAQETDLAQQKKEIQEIAELALKKLEFLDVTTENLSQLQLLLIEIMTRYTDWTAGGLSTAYFSGQLKKAGDMLEQYELCAVPEGWTCEWDRTNCRYFYRNKLSNQTQWEYPDVTGQDKSELPEADSGDAVSSKTAEDSSVRSRDSHKSKNSLSPRHKKKEDKKKHVKHGASRHSHRKRRERSESSNGYSSDDSRHHHRHKSKKKKRHRKERSPHSERREKSNELINIESDEDVCIIEPVGSSNSAPEKSKSVVQENKSTPVMVNTTPPLTDNTSLLVTDSTQQTADPDIDGISLSDPEDVPSELLNPSDDTALSGATGATASVDHETIREVSSPCDNNKLDIPGGTVNTAVISKPPQIIIHPFASLSNLDARLLSAQASTSASSEADPLADRRIPVVPTKQTESVDPLVDGEPLTKKKKKDKKATSSSLMMKKKQVTTLVQKWQKVKKEVEKEDRVKEMRQAAIRAKIEELKTHPDKQ